ncbi:NADH-ubiquinone oxidoreductase 17.3 kDa subunit [Loa loa]|uniref:NADH-ubiquinone oxidoreductase 17.3 kDa subunit n=1 Tax=Loa loa TaxID=7209 RepID=A0A1S0THM7_LOALO|nr:NADH-ubiquinone oxidoreductase 17.3 kDa subunit [Loa loa]EFO13780.2 NADH-ubiquinone oxidoreductase 17.3 kDa subunit [Loa loa]
MLPSPNGLQRVSQRILQNAIRTMYDNPYIKTFKPKKPPSPTFHKQTTGLTGLFVDEYAHQNLLKEYGRLMKVLEQIPSHSAYRRHTEQLIKKRMALVQEEPDIQKLEDKIGMGQIEEAKYEILAAKEILKSQAWEPLVEKAPEGQWNWPIV